MNIEFFGLIILSAALAKHNVRYLELILEHLAWTLQISNFLKLIIDENEI